MTGRDFLPRPGFVLERIWIWLMSIALYAAGFVLLAALTPFWGTIVAIWNTPEALEEVQSTLVEMRAEVRRATGEDRVLRQPPGLSYVQEPVVQGEPVVLYLVVERTTLGRDCVLTDWTPLFTDAANVPLPGRRAAIGPVRRQIAEEPTKLRVEMIPPTALMPGRVEVYLSLEYDCAGKRVPDRTDPVAYRLIPRTGESR